MLVADILVGTTHTACDVAVAWELVVGAAAVVAALGLGAWHYAGKGQSMFLVNAIIWCARLVMNTKSETSSIELTGRYAPTVWPSGFVRDRSDETRNSILLSKGI